MKKIIYSMTAIFAFFIINFCFVSKVDAASTVNFNGDTYTVNESNEYESTNKVKWITIESDRTQGSRMSMEMDLNLIKEYNSSNGVISYKAIKNWINKLEECFDYFCELNKKPAHKDIVIEFTGVSKQIASAYASGANNRIVITKKYHIGTLELIERDYNLGITNLTGTVLHEMGHVFTKVEGYTNFNFPWNYGIEYINMVLEQYVVDKVIKNNSNIVTSLNPYYDVICASDNINTYSMLDGKPVPYVKHNFKDAWYIISEVTKVYIDYSKVIYNTSEIIDAIGQTAFKKVCNSYFNNDLSKYNVSNDYNKFMTFMSIVKANTTSTIWTKVKPYYGFLYDKFVVNIKLKNEKVYIVKGKSYRVDYEITYNNDTHDNFPISYESSNEYVATVDGNGNITGKNIGDTTIFIRVGNQYATMTVEIVESGATSISLNKTEMTMGSLLTSYTLSANVVSSLSENPIKWTSSNENVATVDEKGLVTPKNYGTAIITATTTDGTNLSASCKINICKIAFDKSTYTINKFNESLLLNVTFYPSNFSQKLDWKSSDTNIATVDSTGKVTPVGNGTCKITATTTDGTNRTTSCNITVDIKATGITTSTKSYTITSMNQSPAFTATVSPSNAANKNVIWTSSDTSVVKVVNASIGAIKPVGNGTCKIIATTTDGTNLSTSIDITVNLGGQYQKGDVNKDGKVDVADVTYGMNRLSKGILTDEEKNIGNVNGDSIFDVSDIIKIMRFLSGKISSLD